jgi:hypothetical protein
MRSGLLRVLSLMRWQNCCMAGAKGVFDRAPEEVWIFEARPKVSGITNQDRPLAAQHFAEFEKACGKDPKGLSKRTDAGQAGRYSANSTSARSASALSVSAQFSDA